MAAKQASEKAKSERVFGHARNHPKMFRAGLYSRVSTHDQQTLPLQNHALREYAAKRGWAIAMQVKEVGSGAAQRELREKLIEAARRRDIRCGSGLASGSLGPVCGGSGFNVTGTGASRRRFRIAD